MTRAKQTWIGGTMKLVAGTLSAGAALVSILSYAAANTIPFSLARAHRLTITPARDTAGSIGDSLQLAALVTDEGGAAVSGIVPVWTIADPEIASVSQAGVVVSRRPGATAVIVRVGELEARARVAVVQRPVELQLADTAVWVPEGERRRASVVVGDARGHPVAGATVRWETADAAIAAVDSAGLVTGVSPGRSSLTASFGPLRAAVPVVVVPVAASITVVAGEEQRGAAGRSLANPVTAQMVSRSGRPIAGVPASFVVRGGLGTALPAVDTSDGRGMVQASWTLGPVPGRQQLAISVEGVAVSPVLTAEADPVPANTRVAVAQDGLTATAGDSIPEPVVVRVTDSAGAALADVPVAWRAGDGGSVEPLGERTDSLGEARSRWRLGSKAGRQRLRVQVGNARLLPATTVTATALAGEPVSVAIRGGDEQTGTVGKALAKPVVVRALDRNGNAVPGVAIRVRPSAGEVPDSLISTDSTGQVKVHWTLGQSAGVQRLVFRLAGADPEAEATARARPGAPAKATFVAPPATGTAGRALPKPVLVEVQDTYGNAVRDRSVTFTWTSGTLSSRRVTTDSSGRATVRWTLGGKAGPATLLAKVARSDAVAKLTLRIKARPSP